MMSSSINHNHQTNSPTSNTNTHSSSIMGTVGINKPSSPAADSSPTSSSSKYKSSYLIEKLLNESSATVASGSPVGRSSSAQIEEASNRSRLNGSSPRAAGVITAYDNYHAAATDLMIDDVTGVDKLSSSPIEADARSEAGTYTIDENTPGDIAVLDDLEFKENHLPPASPATLGNGSSSIIKSLRTIPNATSTIDGKMANSKSGSAAAMVGKSITTPSIVELAASARTAAIDQTFGVRRLAESESAGDVMNMVIMTSPQPVKRSPQKATRLRNKTYSLRKDVIDG